MPTGFAVSGLFDNQVIVQREYPLARAASQGGVLEFDAWGQGRGSLASGPHDLECCMGEKGNGRNSIEIEICFFQ